MCEGGGSLGESGIGLGKVAPGSVEPAAAEPKPTEAYDRSYWTPEVITSTVHSFFEKLNRDAEQLRAERERLLNEAIAEAEALETVKREIEALAEQEMEEARKAENEEEREAILDF